ncbi:MAG: glutamate synthase small chain [Thermoleophilaceae bacterium]|jgi:glutamate synthase (NADPH/NADH) small chain|nr:glutamate synthase small chain [Thermoleophilaceae bacterium]
MRDPRGFLEVERVPDPRRDPVTRIQDHREVFLTLPTAELRDQAGRCMGCGVPFCHDACPVGNLIPDWNELVTDGDWRAAIDRLHQTNDFPEFTGMICPAPCEAACTLEINDDPVMIKQVEWSIAERAWDEGWIVPRPPARETGKGVAVVGSGPAGLAAAAQLRRRGHAVTVFERDEAAGGLLRFGIPDFKLEKWVVERRLDLLRAEGIELRCGVEPDVAQLRAEFDAVVLATGSRVERELDVPGRELAGVHFAMEYLYGRNRAVAGTEPNGAPSAAGRHVVVIGGGDTAADCIASAHREGARSVVQLDLYPPPGGTRPREIAGWPNQPRRLPSTYALDEGGERRSAIDTVAFGGEDGRLTHLRAARVSADREPEPDSEHELRADIAFIAIGFAHPAHDGPVEQLGLELDERGNIAGHATSAEGVFAAGDARVGQSLVVTAIADGRECAREVAAYLAG